MAGRQVLAQLGRNDMILSGQPDITFFLEQYKARAPFATRVIDVAFRNQPQYGSDTTVELPMNGDLITAMYARFNIPTTPDLTFYGSAGPLMIERVELYYNNQLIERLWGEFIVLSNECEVPSGQQGGLNNLYGLPAVYPLQLAFAPNAQYTVPLRFKTLQKGLPVIEGIQFRVILNKLEKFSPDKVNINVDFHLFVEYAFLGDAEREWITKKGKRLYLCENVERARYIAPAGVSNIRCITDFLHPVKELFFTVQNQNAIGFDYNLYSSNISGLSNVNQLNALAMTFNDALRLDPAVATYLYLGSAQFLEYHTRIPSMPFYMYSFSLDPEGDEPSGAVNFGRIKHQYFDFYLNPQPSAAAPVNRVITIWARYYQFLEVDDKKSMRVLFDNISETGSTAILR
jgi:hypothetical protein